MKHSLHLTKLIHEKLSTVMNHAYSRTTLDKVINDKFIGEWKYLRKGLFEISEEKANQSCIELATLLRILDDDQKITEYHNNLQNIPSCGKLHLKNGKRIDLTFREFCNKVIHSDKLKWDIRKRNHHRLIIYSYNNDNRGWIKAEVNLIDLAGFCGNLGF
jgi:hypothetical protein